MKASSTGLKIKVHLSKKEALKLRKQDLEGILNFKDYDGAKRQIPFTLKLTKDDKETIDVYHEPFNLYFGNAKNFSITLYPYHHENLLETGTCSDIFYVSGRVSVYLNN